MTNLKNESNSASIPLISQSSSTWLKICSKKTFSKDQKNFIKKVEKILNFHTLFKENKNAHVMPPFLTSKKGSILEKSFYFFHVTSENERDQEKFKLLEIIYLL